MISLKQLYIRGLEGVGDMPSWKKDWRWIAFYSVLIYAIVLAFRLSFAGRWDHPELWVNGERIMATHDAYFWLAKAKGVGNMTRYPLAMITNFLHQFTGLSLGTIGFWTPAVIGSFVGVVCYLWGWLLAGKNAGILAGLIGSLTPGFFYRSRLGYFDSDIFTLLFPMLIAWLQAYWASRHMKPEWFSPPTVGRDEFGQDPKSTLLMALLFGVATRFMGIWHHDIVNFSVMLFFLTTFVIIVNGKVANRGLAFSELAVYGLAAFPGALSSLHGWPFSLIPLYDMGTSFSAVSVALALLLFFWLRIRSKNNNVRTLSPWLGLCFIVFALAFAGVHNALFTILVKVSGYFDAVSTGIGGENSVQVGPIYPSIVQSIIEAKHVALSVALERGCYYAWLGWVAVVFFAVVLITKPLAVFLLPVIVLHLASAKLGVRFSMFGGAALMVCFSIGVFWLLSVVAFHMPRKNGIVSGAQLVLGSVFLVFLHGTYAQLPLTPVLTKAHGEALIQLGNETTPDAMIWTWWDWGYASQYYSGRKTVVDGGKHAGKDVFPVAYALSTDSMQKANKMVAFSSRYPVLNKLEMGLSPSRAWDEIPRDKILETLEKQLAKDNYPASAPQYIVVTWKDLTIAKWITYFGNWNLQTGTTQEASIGNYDPGELGINMQRGAVMNRDGGGGLVRDITVLDRDGVEKTDYYMNTLSPQLLPKRQHLVINKVTRQSVIMDRIVYRSTMMRLLTGDPRDPEVSKYFKLVVDKLPFARIYEVVQ